MEVKRIILTILLFIWLVIIFLFSNQSGDNSQKLSDKTTIKVIEMTSLITNKKYSDDEMKNFVDDSRFIIRKIAHIMIYLVLGCLVYLTLDSYNIKHELFYSLIFCLLYAISDEIHQYFIGQRSSQVLDVFIDFSGSLLGIFIVKFLDNRNFP